MKAKTLEAILADIGRKRPVVLATDLDSGDQRLLHGGDGETEAERADVAHALRIDASFKAVG